MKKIEITVDDELHRRLQEASKRASKSVDQLVRGLLVHALEELEGSDTVSQDLLAEGYQAMAKEHTQTVKESLAAQVMALENQDEVPHDRDSQR